MKNELHKYTIKTPENYCGEIAGKLTSLGVMLKAINMKNGIVVMDVESETDIICGFKSWLSGLTNSKATIERN